MKSKQLLFMLVLCIAGIIQKSYSQANTNLSNLVSPSINKTLLPNAINSINLGSPTLPFFYVYVNRVLFPDGTFQTSASKWSTNGTSMYYNAGYVGIGTSTPTSRLQVAGDANINGLTVGLGSGGSPINTVFGYQALSSNTLGGLNNGLNNTAIGYQALKANTTGWENTAVGYLALALNTTGVHNTAIGMESMDSNTTGLYNTAMGERSLHALQTGRYNTAVGNGTLSSSVDGYYNTATGAFALGKISPFVSYNTACGAYALNNSTDGISNTAVGMLALNSNTTGSDNTALGASANVSSGTISNASVIGSGAIVNASNKVRLGNTSVTIVESSGTFVTSDGRFKFNIKEDVKGLEFIKLLRPVVYNFDSKKFQAFLMQQMPKEEVEKQMKAMNASLEKASLIRQTGFIAQEVDAAAKQIGYDFNGVHCPENANDNYSISYEKIVVPLVKAVQELSTQNEALKKRLDVLEEKLNVNKETINLSAAKLEQNIPNPANQSTIINYYLPRGTANAVIEISGTNGKIKTIPLTANGNGQLQLQTGSLTSGIYTYSLIIEGKVTDTKQIVLAR